MYTSGCPGTYYIDQAGFELTEICLQGAGIKGLDLLFLPCANSLKSRFCSELRAS